MSNTRILLTKVFLTGFFRLVSINKSILFYGKESRAKSQEPRAKTKDFKNSNYKIDF